MFVRNGNCNVDDIEKKNTDGDNTYGHGGDIYSAKEKLSGASFLDFSANLNPFGLPEGVKKAICEHMEEYSAYPDPFCRELVEGLSRFEGVPEEWILCGNGAADLIFHLVYGARPKKALVLAPTFSEYEEALQQVDCEVRHYVLKRESGFQPDEGILEALADDLDMVFFCNPNNPTGRLLVKERLLPLISRCKELDIILVVDECFNGFLEEAEAYSVKEYAEDYSNLVVLRAFTKTYAMAGLRLGYCITSDGDLRKRIAAAGPPWKVSIVAQVAGLQAIKEKEYLAETKRLLRKEKAYLIDSLGGLGISFISSGANYLFFQWPFQEEAALGEVLFQKGFLIRNCDNYHGLEAGYYRICIKEHEENQRLIQAMTEITERITGQEEASGKKRMK